MSACKNKLIPSFVSVIIKTPLMSSSQRNALVLFRVRVGDSLSVCSQSHPKCYFTPPPPTPHPHPISNNSSQTLTRNPFPHKPMKTSKPRHTSAAGPFKGTFAPLCFFFSPFSPFFLIFSSFPPHGVIVQISCYSLSLHRPSTFHLGGISWIS